MRTTVDLPADLRRRLAQEAAARNLKGYSRLVVEALRLYFGNRGETREDTVRRLRGSLNAQQADREIERLRAVRLNSRS